MPYRHAHWYVLAIFPLAALAFWPTYLGQFAAAGAALHAHGITASLWVALLAFQSWTITRSERDMHRIGGWMSLILFPLFMAGGVSIFIGMAERYVAAASPFHVIYAPRLAWLDVVAVAGVGFFYFRALQHRRFVQVHSRYMLATILFLLPPVLARLSPFVPWLAVTGPGDFHKIGWGVQIANAITLALALALAMRPARQGRPFLIAAGLVAVSMVLFETIGRWPAWQALFAKAAALPLAPVIAATSAGAAAVAWAGWMAGSRGRTRLAAEPV